MTPYESRLLELLERIESTLNELRDHIRAQPAAASPEAIEAFADEAFRDRDA